MPDSKNLYEQINPQVEALRKFDSGVIKIPEFITTNLKHNIFDWQREAIENLIYYENEKSGLKKTPTHLMFNMATGSGKTLVMASALLYYYKRGYRKFIFFVNTNNVVDKTENNFLESSHKKYLFKDKIIIEDKKINIKRVENFSDELADIEIKFTTIQQLYNDIHIQKENQTTREDLLKRDIVMLADEAHHLNALTKNKKEIQEELIPSEINDRTSEAEIEKKGWEHTVIDLILHKNQKENSSKNKNILLEFTATIDSDKNVFEKYKDKIVYKFDLKDFLARGYTKEINLISSTLNKKERILQALLFNWYRHKIALKNNIPNFKPVILFRSRTINESKEDFIEFLKLIENLSVKDFKFLKYISDKLTQSNTPYEQGKSRTIDVLNFIKIMRIELMEIVDFLKSRFNERSCIITNSETNKTKKEKTTDEQNALLNNLEDRSNHIRAIFTVERLTEGWDVLNLYDIVRLYQGQNAGGSTKKIPEATTKEKQLIGRGVRYFPFEHKGMPTNKRKFDGDLNNEMRVLEELYYYTYDEESRYITHLKNELRKEGYIDDGKILKKFSLKSKFKDNDFYKKVKIWYNEQEDNPHRKKNSLEEIEKDFGPYKIQGFEIREQEMNLNEDKDTERLKISENKFVTKIIKISSIDKHIKRKAISIKSKQPGSFFCFEKLKENFNILSTEELFDNFLESFDIKVIMEQDKEYSDVSNREMLGLLLKFFDDFLNRMKQITNPYKGGEFRFASFEKLFGEPKVKNIKRDEESERIEKELSGEEWYVLDSFCGTDQEKGLIKFIREVFGNLKEKYEEVYILRNEEVYKIYDFNSGKGFQPDFLLFLKGKSNNEYYQVFIEPKGDQLIEHDTWKNNFLKEITKRYGKNKILNVESKNYILIGLPLFNESKNEEFENKFKEKLL